MSRKTENRAYQIGDYWLSKQARSDVWCRTWYDSNSRQTRRSSLREEDFELAKQKLTDWFVLQHSKPTQEIAQATIAEIFARFYEHHGQTLVSARDVKRNLNYWLDFHEDATVEEAADQQQQTKFRDWLHKTRGMSLASVRTCLLIGKSALNWAWKRGEIAQIPYIPLVKPPKPEPKGRPLEVDEVVKLFAHAKQQHIRTLMAFMIGTAARTGAMLDMTIDQIDIERHLIHLNPEGRPQNNKFRPTVKLPSQLLEYAAERSKQVSGSMLISFNDKPVASVKTSWRKLVSDCKFNGNVQTYSFRHTVARWMRMQGVPAWEVAAQLGHKAPDFTTTEIYAPFDPTYLSKAVAAIDDFFGLVACELRVKTISEYLLKEA